VTPPPPGDPSGFDVDGLRGLDLQGLLRRASKMKEDVDRARAALRDRRVEGRAGGGMVVATCDGTGELVRVRFEDGLLAREEASVVEDLVVAAVRDARRRAADVEREAMGGLLGPAAGGFPGFPA
jgi:DNA-binding YbaB/EbfC family protein